MTTTALTRTLQLCVIFVTLCAISGSIYALPMEVTAGFDGITKANVWTPLAVTISNTSDEDIEGVLLVQQPEGSRKDLPSYRAQVNLPARSKKLYHVYAKFAEYGGDATVILARGRGTLGMKKIKVNPSSIDDRLLVTIGSRSARLNFMSGVTFNAPSKLDYSHTTPITANIQAGSIDQKALPDRPAGYEGADVIVISDLSPESTSPKALRALAMWVASGGTLVIPTGPNYRRFQHEFYDDLLPVKVTGTVNLPSAGTLSVLGGSPFPQGAVAACASIIKPATGRVIAAEGGVPLVVERNYGAGRVIFIALESSSAPFRDWNGQTKFWKNIVTARVSKQPMVTAISSQIDPSQRQYGYHPHWDTIRSGMAVAVMQNPSMKTPSFNTIGIFLLSYLVTLVPVNYYVLRRKSKLELAWVTTPAIVLLFSFGAYVIGYTMKGGSLILRQATFVEASSGSRCARAISYASLFSPARRNYDVQISDPYALGQVLIIESEERAPAAYMGEKSTLENINMAMWASKTFESCSGKDLGGTLDTKLKMSGDQVTGEIINNTGIAFKDCWIAFGDNEQRIGRMPRGHSVNVNVSYGAYDGNSRDFFNVDESRRFKVFVDNAVRRVGQPVLVAWADSGDEVFSLAEGSPKINSATCYVFHLDCEVGGHRTIRPEMVKGTVLESSNVSVEFPPHSNSNSLNASTPVLMYSPGSYYVASYSLPTPGANVGTLVVKGNTSNAAGTVLRISIMNVKTGQWELITEKPGPVNFTTASGADYVAPGGEVKIKVKLVQGNGARANIRISGDCIR